MPKGFKSAPDTTQYDLSQRVPCDKCGHILALHTIERKIGTMPKGMKSLPQPPNACGFCRCSGFQEKEEEQQRHLRLTIPKGNYAQDDDDERRKKVKRRRGAKIDPYGPTLPIGYEPPPVEKERIERLEREHQKQLSSARGIDVEYDRRRQQAASRRLQKMVLGIVALCLFPVLIVAAAITMNWYLIGAFLVGLAVIATFAFSGSAGSSSSTAYAAGHYWGAARGRSFRMWAADRATRKRG